MKLYAARYYDTTQYDVVLYRSLKEAEEEPHDFPWMFTAKEWKKLGCRAPKKNEIMVVELGATELLTEARVTHSAVTGHCLCRPPKGAWDVEKLVLGKKLKPEWVPDDGKPGYAFSGRSVEGYPCAWYSGECNHPTECVESLVADRTCQRYGAANAEPRPVFREKRSAAGAILVTLGVITKEQLRTALEHKANSSFEQLLGIVLVHLGMCSQEDIDAAVSAQKSRRDCKDKSVCRAVAAIDFAIRKKGSNGARQKAISKAAALYKSQTGTEYMAVTPAMLAKSSSGR